MDIINYINKDMPLKKGDKVKICDFKTARELYRLSKSTIGCLEIMDWGKEATIETVYNQGQSYTLREYSFRYIREWLTKIY